MYLVAPEDVDGVLVCDHRMLGAPRSHKLVTLRHLPPPVDGLEGPKVQGQTLGGVRPVGVEVGVEGPGIRHPESLEHFNPRSIGVLKILLSQIEPYHKIKDK